MSTAMKSGERKQITLAEAQASVGAAPTTSDWIVVDQAMIDGFAQVTGDFAFIHTDPERAKHTRFKGTIAHGLLTLSLLPQMMASATPLIEDVKMGVNYGFDRVRFIAPVPVNSRVRALIALVALPEDKPGFFRFTYDVTVELEGSPKPALAARWMLGRWMDG
ncbi:Acyl dehydratase [Sphingobium faniae]|nr:Acyl dehydratase [Sphingobium faniae]